MTKTATKRAIRALPALRASIIWHKREVVRELRVRAVCASSPKLRAYLHEKARKVSRTELADLRYSYEAARVSEIVRARRFELARVVPAIVWLTAEAHDR